MMSNTDGPELIVPYDPEQRDLYERNDSRSIYYAGRWPENLRRGRNRDGRFPEIAVRASFRALGFSVLISEPRMPAAEGFILAHFSGMRESVPPHPAYARMFDYFDRAKIEEFNLAADAAKTAATGNRGGGDPDLFVFCKSGRRYFVEVKDEEGLNENQRKTFPLIRSILDCEVLIARLMPSPSARLTDLDITPCLEHRLTAQRP
jgi:hypothetical protein